MQPFTYVRAETLDAALAEAAQPGAALMAGGTTMVDTDARRPGPAPLSASIDIGHLSGTGRRSTPPAPNCASARSPAWPTWPRTRRLLRDYPALAREPPACRLAANPQCRDRRRAILLQRTRCLLLPRWRLQPATSASRAPGAAAQDGIRPRHGAVRWHFGLGASPPTRATGATPWPRSTRRSRCASTAGRTRTIPFAGVASYPMATIRRAETTLRPGEIITAIVVQATPAGKPLHLPQGARPPELRLRRGFGRCGA